MGAKVGTPIVRATGARKGMSLISAVISRGDMRFMIIGKGSVYADVFIEFLKRLIRGAGRKNFLIVDRGPAHRAKKAGAFVQPLARKLRLFLLMRKSQFARRREAIFENLGAHFRRCGHCSLQVSSRCARWTAGETSSNNHPNRSWPRRVMR